jgi:hypothetical protein
MARPKKHNVDYFTHDVQMRNDIKIKALRRKYKHLGYSIYNITLELLGDAEYFEIKWDDESIELLTPEYDCDKDELLEVIQYCIKLDLLQITHGYLNCRKFTERLEGTVLVRRTDYCKENSQIHKLKEVIDNNNFVELNNNDIIDDINAQSKVKESKLNKSKGEESTGKESRVPESTLPETTENKRVVNSIVTPEEFDNLFNDIDYE